MSTFISRGRRKEVLFLLLPNLFTAANLFFGFFAVLSAYKEKWETAAFAIFIGALADALDGRVARLTKAQSAFGEQFDSMADLISFGMAPAVLIYHWALTPFGRWGWLAAFLYLLCAALRLARFNVLKQTVEKRYFQGIPSPAAAGTVASAVLFYQHMGFSDVKEPFILFIVFVIALAMISTLRYRSFKDMQFKSQKTFAWIILSLSAAVVFSPDPEMVLFPVACTYVLSAPIGETWRWLFRRIFRTRIRRSSLK